MGHELPCPSSWSAFFPPGTGIHSPAHPHPCLVCPEQGNRLWKLSWGVEGGQQEEVLPEDCEGPRESLLGC